MKQRGTLFRRLTEEVGRSAQPLPGVPIVEIAGERRVLIENHRGVQEYNADRICVGVSFGKLYVEGSCMEICQMTAHQLVICGRIRGVILERGKG